MTKETQRLAQHVIGLYKIVRLQQEFLARYSLQIEAFSRVAESVPNVKDALGAALWEVQASQTALLLSETLKLTDVTILGMEKEYGSSETPPMSH